MGSLSTVLTPGLDYLILPDGWNPGVNQAVLYHNKLLTIAMRGYFWL